MKATDIQSLLDFISKAGLDEVSIETENLKLSVKRFSQVAPISNVVTPVITPISTPVIQSTPQVVAQPTTPAVEKVEIPKTTTVDESKLVAIKSPMIGTFYRTPNPDSPPFVNVGDEIKVGKVVCIIEAMKLFNEIESEVSGKIVKVLVENATPVEYDQPLFLVQPH
jgi:acetyl-CoA carboxylase biotin carboxyl carrier protein